MEEAYCYSSPYKGSFQYIMIMPNLKGWPESSIMELSSQPLTLFGLLMSMNDYMPVFSSERMTITSHFA